MIFGLAHIKYLFAYRQIKQPDTYTYSLDQVALMKNKSFGSEMNIFNITKLTKTCVEQEHILLVLITMIYWNWKVSKVNFISASITL